MLVVMPIDLKGIGNGVKLLNYRYIGNNYRLHDIFVYNFKL